MHIPYSTIATGLEQHCIRCVHTPLAASKIWQLSAKYIAVSFQDAEIYFLVLSYYFLITFCLQVAAVGKNGDPLGDAAAAIDIAKMRNPYYKCASQVTAYMVVCCCKNWSRTVWLDFMISRMFPSLVKTRE